MRAVARGDLRIGGVEVGGVELILSAALLAHEAVLHRKGRRHDGVVPVANRRVHVSELRDTTRGVAGAALRLVAVAAREYVLY